jgi:energy-dependent translational throttle protein EttA
VREPELRADIACFEGNYAGYIEDLRRRKGPNADQSHRIAYESRSRLARG